MTDKPKKKSERRYLHEQPWAAGADSIEDPGVLDTDEEVRRPRIVPSVQTGAMSRELPRLKRDMPIASEKQSKAAAKPKSTKRTKKPKDA